MCGELHARCFPARPTLRAGLNAGCLRITRFPRRCALPASWLISRGRPWWAMRLTHGLVTRRAVQSRCHSQNAPVSSVSPMRPMRLQACSRASGFRFLCMVTDRTPSSPSRHPSGVSTSNRQRTSLRRLPGSTATRKFRQPSWRERCPNCHRRLQSSGKTRSVTCWQGPDMRKSSPIRGQAWHAFHGSRTPHPLIWLNSSMPGCIQMSVQFGSRTLPRPTRK